MADPQRGRYSPRHCRTPCLVGWPASSPASPSPPCPLNWVMAVPDLLTGTPPPTLRAVVIPPAVREIGIYAAFVPPRLTAAEEGLAPRSGREMASARPTSNHRYRGKASGKKTLAIRN